MTLLPLPSEGESYFCNCNFYNCISVVQEVAMSRTDLLDALVQNSDLLFVDGSYLKSEKAP